MFVHRMRHLSLASIALAVVVIGRGSQSARANANATTAPAATEYTSDVDAGTVTVSGTSTLHDWTATGGTINGMTQCSGPWTGAPSTLRSIQLSIPVDSLKSSEGSGMDKTMYDALKMNADPLISYDLTRADLISPPSKDDPAYRYEAVGQLTIAGNTCAVNLTLDIQPGDGGKLTIATQTRLKMTDFGMKPPTAMLGMIVSGDEVTVTVTWKLAPKLR